MRKSNITDKEMRRSKRQYMKTDKQKRGPAESRPIHLDQRRLDPSTSTEDQCWLNPKRLDGAMIGRTGQYSNSWTSSLLLTVPTKILKLAKAWAGPPATSKGAGAIGRVYRTSKAQGRYGGGDRLRQGCDIPNSVMSLLAACSCCNFSFPLWCMRAFFVRFSRVVFFSPVGCFRPTPILFAVPLCLPFQGFFGPYHVTFSPLPCS